MKKTTGKVLSFVLSLALVLTSFPAMLASASTKHTVQGTLSDTDKDKVYLVNGGVGDKAQMLDDLQGYIFGDKDQTVETKDHQEKPSAKIAAISHKSGDRLVKWYEKDDDKKDSIADDTNDVALQLRSSTVKGEEVLDILYKGTYTDDNGDDVTVKASKEFTVHVYDKGSTVIGKADAAGDKDVKAHKKSAELSDNFAEKTVKHESNVDDHNKNKDTNNDDVDKMNLIVWQATLPDADCGYNGVAETDNETPYVVWKPLKTVVNDKTVDDKTTTAYYTLKSSNDNLSLKNSGVHESNGSVVATNKAPGITLSGSKYKVENLLSDSTGVKYAYTKNGKDPALKPDVADATGTDENTKVLTDKAIDLSGDNDATGGETIKVQGFAQVNSKWVAVTDVATGTFTYAGDAGANSTFAPADDSKTAGIGTLALAFKADSHTEVDIATATLHYYDQADSGDWEVGKTTELTSYKTAPTAGQTVTVKAFVSTTAAKSDSAADIETLSKTTGIDIISASFTVEHDDDNGTYVTASVTKPSSGNVTLTAEPTKAAKDMTNDKTITVNTVKLSTTKNVTVKNKIDKKIKVDVPAFKHLIKYDGSTYISTDSSLDSTSYKNLKEAIKVNGLEVNFDGDTCEGISVDVSNKASVSKISGKLNSLSIEDGSTVGSISLDKCSPSITVSEAKVGDIKFDDVDDDVNNKENKLDVNSTKAVVGNVTNATEINVNSGRTGNLEATKSTTAQETTIIVKADDDTATTEVGNLKAKSITLDSENSKLSVGTVTAGDDDSDITLQGNNLAVKAIDFDYRNATLKTDDFQGTIPAPKNATTDGATISTNNGDDRLEVSGDCDVNSVDVSEDDSQIKFDGKLNVTDVSGDGIVAIGAGKMNIKGSVTGAILKLSDPTLTKGMTAFTATSDTVDTDSFNCYGFTLAKTAGTKTDTFKVDTVVFKGLAVNKATDEIAKGDSAKYTACAYPGGTTMPKGYTIDWNLEGDDSIFTLVKNADGTATVTANSYDTDFASNNKATLKCTMVDADGNDVDEDTFCSGECDITAIPVRKVTHISDTTKNFSLAQGASYQFKITSSDGSEPAMSVGSGSLAVTKVGKSGNAYFFKVTAVGKVGDQVGVYLDKSRLLVITISASSVKLDTGAKINVAKGKTYQFKATSTTAVKATSGNSAVFQVVKSTKTGNNTYVTVKATGNKGQCTGIYFNGVRRTIATVA